MELLATAIPSADVAPEQAKPSEVARTLRRHSASRRTVLRTVIGAGMAVGVTAVGLLPNARRANAGWYSTYSNWGHCSAHPYRACSAGDVSSGYCNGAGFHRDDTGRSGCYNWRYSVVFTRCYNTSYTSARNAWLWYRGESGGSVASFRCSDGDYWENYCGDVFTTGSACLVYL
jgi:hypothetical protein